jgi:glutamyl-Q tRNA(Asp) synthetase
MQPVLQPVFRFAPSPNGHLHLGHAASALLNQRMALETGGRFLLRIEDIDTARCTDRLVADCFEDLAWLGLEWEEPVLRQSSQFARYIAAGEALEARGLAFRCACTRGDIQRAAGANPPRDPEGSILYPGTCHPEFCRDHPPGEGSTALEHVAQKRKPVLRHNIRQNKEIEHGFDPIKTKHALRLDMRAALAALPAPLHWCETGEGTAQAVSAEPQLWGDVVLIRKDIPASYHLAVVLDDALQGVTHVVRGRDLYAATGIHRLLQALFGLPEPVYHHHALVLDEAGRKLAKSAASTPLRQLRAEGVTAEAIRHRLGFG